jgi:hypothetical protein
VGSVLFPMMAAPLPSGAVQVLSVVNFLTVALSGVRRQGISVAIGQAHDHAGAAAADQLGARAGRDRGVIGARGDRMRDSDRILGILSSKTKRAIEGKEPIKEHLLITRYSPSRVEGGQMLSLKDVEEILRIPLIGVIPESESVLDASNQGLPAVHLKGTDVSEAYKDVVGRFLGESIPMRFTDAEKPSFLKRLFGGR